MEDAAEALKLAFSVFVFIIALGVAFSTFSQSREVADIVIAHSDREYLEAYTEAEDEDIGRKVGAETVIPTLYRYYKENFAVDIASNSGHIKEVFDLTVEGNYRDRVNDNYKPDKLYKNSTSYSDLYPDGVHWIGANTDGDTAKRVDTYVSCQKKEINGVDINAKTKFDFNKIYRQSFTEEYEGEKIAYTPSGEEPDGSYFIKRAGGTKIYMTFTETE